MCVKRWTVLKNVWRAGQCVLKNVLRAGQHCRVCQGLGSAEVCVEGWVVLKGVLRAGQH